MNMDVFIILVVLLALLFFLVLQKGHRNKVYFESKGIVYLGNGTIRLLVNIVKGAGFMENLCIQYRTIKARNMKVGGSNDFGVTSLMIQDPDLLRSILVKDFDHFADRKKFKLPKGDKLLAKMLVSLSGGQWKALRSKLSPTFTTGKIKRLFCLFDQSGKKLVNYIEQEITNNGGEMDLVEGYSKFTMDIIASAVCGIDSKAFDQKEASLFEKMGMKLQINFGGFQIFKLVVMFVVPKLGKILGLSLFDKEVEDFFSVAIKSSIQHRLERNERRNDFIQLMLDAREYKLETEESELDNFEKDAILKKSLVGDDDGAGKTFDAELLDDDGVVASAVLFMLAGYDTTQSLLIFCAYALAINQDIQDKLRDEVDLVVDDGDGEFNYESINKMVYLDMIIHETLRCYPPILNSDRDCTSDYKIPGTDFILKKGQTIYIPIYALHHDEEYFPEPEKFDPERFSLENKAKIKQFAFLPFGQGPRNCIGRRFALAEVKVAIAHLVHNFRIEPSKKTLIPMKFSSATVSVKPKGGMFLALSKIKH